MFGDFNAKLESEDIFKPTIGNETLHQDSKDNDIRIVNNAISEDVVVPPPKHLYVHNTWNSPYGKKLQIDHILIDRRWHSSILDVRSFRRVDCDNDHNLVVAKVRERWAVSKQAAQTFDMGRFHPRKLSELEVMKGYQIEIYNGLQLWRTYIMATTKAGLGKTLKSVSKPQLNRV